MGKVKFSILITTKNRVEDLLFTLSRCHDLKRNNELEIMVFDDGSTDGTSEKVRQNYPNIILHRNEVSKGYMYCRNKMLNESKGQYAISLDDDANFLSDDPLEKIEAYFNEHSECGLIAFRIFWGLESPLSIKSKESSSRVRGFVGCGHVWRMSAWKTIPNYPEWFVFYGEEQFAALQLFKNKWEIHYFPEVLVHHRVDVKSRKQQSDYQIRLRRSLRSGWYLYFMFYPVKQIPKRFFYTLVIQIKKRVFKGDLKGTVAILQALGDVVVNFFRLMKQSNRLSPKEMKLFNDLPKTKIYWNPEDGF